MATRRSKVEPVILDMDKPDIPLETGYANSTQISSSFVTLDKTTIYGWAVGGKINMYRYRNNNFGSYFDIAEVLEHTDPDKLTDLGKQFLQSIQDARMQNRKGRIDYYTLYKQAEKMLEQMDEPVEQEDMTDLSDYIEASTYERKENKVSGRFDSQESINKALEEPKQIPDEIPTDLINDRPLEAPRDLSLHRYNEIMAEIAQKEPEPAKPEMYHNSLIVMSPIRMEINLTIETHDPDMLMEMSEVYAKLLDIKRRVDETI